MLRQNGVKYDEIKATMRVPKSTVARYETMLKNGGKPRSTPGPRPVLSTALEDDIYSRVVAMQMAGFPVGRTEICAKAHLVCEVLNIRCVTGGWYQRFLGRYPDLTIRVAQVVSRARNGLTKDAMITLFGTLQKLVIELKLDATRIFNMDESPFLSRTKSKTVVALRGSHNVWTTEPPSSVHISYVACVSATGLLVPPLFILPGARVTEDIALAANVSDCRVTCSEKGLINCEIFFEWLVMFHEAVPPSVARPLVLTFGGYRSHLSSKIVNRTETLGIKLVCLPANSTHLVQPLDVAVFAPLKKAIRRHVHTSTLTGGASSMSKAEVIRVACNSWRDGMQSVNCVRGFAGTGIYPPSLPRMYKRIELFSSGGVKKERPLMKPWDTSWVQRQQVRQDVLLLPAPMVSKTKVKKRKTVDVSERLLTAAMINQELQASAQQKPAKAKKAVKKRRTTV
ncbi:hypothetical protein ACHHYP_16324 [Achlya hypogyna]|uniref:HTH CENPB-type domain-containing protein n=1 Tax=Achlya hypogyna TaxID=1202772 RepID=A0A1V9Y968_ACHHY|nr:hypothetical protein ACHHYP_16324 [Achlya hypogyna]